VTLVTGYDVIHSGAALNCCVTRLMHVFCCRRAQEFAAKVNKRNSAAADAGCRWRKPRRENPSSWRHWEFPSGRSSWRHMPQAI